MTEKVEVRFMARKKQKRRKRTYNQPSKPVKKKLRIGRWTLLFLVGQLVGFIAIYTYLGNSAVRGSNPKSNGILITAAHLPKEDVGKQYKLLYSDKESDKAYYLDTTYVGPTQLLQKVKIKGISSAEIVDTKAGSFTVEVKDQQEIFAGLSGERVYDVTGKKVLGFVSAMVKGGKLYCVSID